MSDFAEIAKKALHDNGWSWSAAARAINYDLAYLSRVLHGRQRPSLKLAESLDDILGTGGALSALVLGSDDASRVERSMDRPTRLDGATVEALAGVLAAYRRLDDTMNPRSVLSPTLAQINQVTCLLKDARGPHREQLMAVASEFMQFGGWMHAQVRQDTQAVSMLNQAIALAEEIADGTLAAQARNFLGHLSRQQGRPVGVAHWYTAAARTPGAHPAQRVENTLLAAGGLAEMGKTAEALRMVEKAERWADAAAAIPPPATAYWLTPNFNRLDMGLCTLALGRYDEAVDHLSAGLAGLPRDQQGAAWTTEHRGALLKALEAR
ncbi:helix-turn-helix transcriptional regulator [Streptomyces sp. B1866]|uniref:helix-turn-helix domain-containing protein n=1 Tax=Streptomyces sp. B1866 TaxID=3075431 RepID=UPI0028900710|nr:helix-turn-helix transcriptional regulator [Streptomyces sp. B1866]MDT3398175.1 helix-turn-helix transcriptional regulator [Streptomyces sp. B1866]